MTIDRIAPVRDILKARKIFVGKILWCQQCLLKPFSASESSDNLSVLIARATTKRLRGSQPVQVIGIGAAEADHISAPVRVAVITKSGEKGYVDVEMSQTNGRPRHRRKNFDEFFFTENPREIYKWPNEIWALIEEGKVSPGMTVEQAQLSWGRPEKINNTSTKSGAHEQWVYGNGLNLYFEKGRLTSTQSSSN